MPVDSYKACVHTLCYYCKVRDSRMHVTLKNISDSTFLLVEMEHGSLVRFGWAEEKFDVQEL